MVRYSPSSRPRSSVSTSERAITIRLLDKLSLDEPGGTVEIKNKRNSMAKKFKVTMMKTLRRVVPWCRAKLRTNKCLANNFPLDVTSFGPNGAKQSTTSSSSVLRLIVKKCETCQTTKTNLF